MRRTRVRTGAAWTLLTLALSLVAAGAAVALPPQVDRLLPPGALDPLSSAWYAAFLLCVPVFLAARRSLLMALPAVAAAAVPQVVVAMVGVDRVGSRTGFAELVYLVPILMTLAYLAAALAGGLVRAVELHRSRAGRLEP
jgi:hypothetical protein